MRKNQLSICKTPDNESVNEV